MNNFSVIWRNPGHWDIYCEQAKIYKIRGGPGRFFVLPVGIRDKEEKKEFKTITASMAYICDNLMHELIIVDGQEPIVIESWHI